MRVMLARLGKQISTSNVASGTTISAFLTSKKLKFTASVRVNAKTVTARYKLKTKDIVTVIGKVSGGR